MMQADCRTASQINDWVNEGLAVSTGAGHLSVDLVRAHALFNLAAAAGSLVALDLRAEVAAGMSSAEIVEALRMARKWLASGL